MPSFDIILTVFNRLDYTKRTVGSLFGSGAVGACERLVIVDNHSTEAGVQEFLTDMTRYDKVSVLRRPRNDGWATAVNDALGLSRASYVLLVNNDVEFTPGFYLRMLETMKANPTLGLLAGWRHTAHSVTQEYVDYDEMTDVPAVCWMLSKEAMQKVGMLEERGPCATKGGNGEDSNYVQLMKAAGYQTGAIKQDVATHLDGY